MQDGRGESGPKIRVGYASSQAGWVLVAASDRGVCDVELGDRPEDLRKRAVACFGSSCEQDSEAARWAGEIAAYIDNPRGALDVPLDLRGTTFQRRVWMALRRLRHGETTSYAALARRIGQPLAVRAVAQACAANRIAILIPCHRVIESSGAPGGYRWGRRRKKALLARERASVAG